LKVSQHGDTSHTYGAKYIGGGTAQAALWLGSACGTESSLRGFTYVAKKQQLGDENNACGSFFFGK
jgi:hypothetical protein